MKISGFEVQVAKDPLFLAWVLVVDVIADTGFEIGGDLGAVGLQLAAWTQAEVSPFETHRRQLVLGHVEKFGQLLMRRGREPDRAAVLRLRAQQPSGP